MRLPFYSTLKILPLFLVLFFLGCYAPKFLPKDLALLQTTEELGAASRQAYKNAKAAQNKTEKLDQAHFGMAYAEKCLKKNPQDLTCLYYNILNTGIYIKNYIANFQKGLRNMVAQCQTLLSIQPSYEEGGCYRILGNIYAKAPSFSLSSKGITQDLEKSVEYLTSAVQVAPDNALNHLFLSRSLEAIGENETAIQQLKEFDRLTHQGLDSEYPEWKQERDALAKKLHLDKPQKSS
jgi:hypothetical protein